MDQYELIRTAHRVYQKSIRQIARETGHHRKTIRKVLAGKEPGYRRQQNPVCPVMEPCGAGSGELDRGGLGTAEQATTYEPPDLSTAGRRARIWRGRIDRAALGARLSGRLGMGRSPAVIPLDPEDGPGSGSGLGDMAMVRMEGEPGPSSTSVCGLATRERSLYGLTPGNARRCFLMGTCGPLLILGGLSRPGLRQSEGGRQTDPGVARAVWSKSDLPLFAVITLSRPVSAIRSGAGRKAAWKGWWGMHGATFWCRFRR